MRLSQRCRVCVREERGIDKERNSRDRQSEADRDFQLSSVALSCLTLCDPVDCSTPGFPDHHKLLELVQTHERERLYQKKKKRFNKS